MIKKISFFTVAFLYLCIGVSLAGTVQLPQTGQIKCYDTAGAEIPCAGTGQDGEIQSGVAWPNPRFFVEGNCVTDNLTGLIWARDANLLKEITNWQTALNFVAFINSGDGLCGYQDWRLPNVNELESLVHFGQPDSAAWLNTQGFINVQPNYYWSSSSVANHTSNAWVVLIGDGYVTYGPKSGNNFVWLVRNVQGGALGDSKIWRTGQTKCFDQIGTEILCSGTGQDGEIQSGVAWPSPRFTEYNNQTVTDNLTGLTWSKDADAPGPAQCSPGGAKTWQNALLYIKCLNSNQYLGYSDWKLPNSLELHSLTDYSEYDPSLPAGHPFINVQFLNNVESTISYWSSSSHAYFNNYAWFVFMWSGGVDNYVKENVHNVWPVRSGQGGPPGVSTEKTTILAGSSAQLNGTINPSGLSTTYYFEWGPTASYGNFTGNQSAGSGSGNVAVNAFLNGLTRNTIYHYRLVAVNALGTTYGLDRTFIIQITNGDLNGDGAADILWRNVSTGQIYLWLMNGLTAIEQGGLGTVDLGWEIKGVGDFNGDDKADILWRYAVTGQVYIWLMNGLTAIEQGGLGTVDLGWEIKGVGDFNGDGKKDILWRHAVTGQVNIWLMNGTAVAAAGSPGAVSDLNWEVKGVGDFNGDGKADILWQQAASGTLYIWLMNGTAFVSGGSPGTVSDSSWAIVAR